MKNVPFLWDIPTAAPVADQDGLGEVPRGGSHVAPYLLQGI